MYSGCKTETKEKKTQAVRGEINLQSLLAQMHFSALNVEVFI